MARIDFLDPRHHEGVNSTVRKGVKQLFPGDHLELHLTGHPVPAGTAEVVMTVVLRMKDISEPMLWHQHTEETQSLDGLWMAMVKAYGAMHHLDVVTIIYYRVDKEED